MDFGRMTTKARTALGGVVATALLASTAAGVAATERTTERGPEVRNAPAWVPALQSRAEVAVREAAPTRLITMPEEGSPFIAFNIWVRSGSQNDPAGKEGLASLTASVVGNGATAENSLEAIQEALYPMATGWGSSVDKEMTVFQAVVHRDNLEAFYELFREQLMNPALSQEDFERIKAQTMNFVERGRRFQRDEELSKELLMWMAYEGTPYEHPEEGYVQSVASITLDDVREFYRNHYLRDAVVVAVGGGYPEGFPERVRADFDRLPAGEAPTVTRPQPRQPEGNQVLIVEKATDATAISMGFPTDILRGDEDFYALMTFNAWFGQHRNSFSHLYQVIRATRGMNYGNYSYIEAFPNGWATQSQPTNISRRSHLFEIWIRPISGTGPGTLHKRSLFATRAALREFDRVLEEGMPEGEVERTVNFLHNFTVNYGNTVLRRLSYAVDDAFYEVPAPGYLESIRPALAELTPERVNAAVREYLSPEGMYLVFITRDAEAFKAKLLSGEATGITYQGDQPQSVLEEDDEIASFPIPVEEEDITILQIGEVFEGG